MSVNIAKKIPCMITPPKFNSSPLKMVVGRRFFSYWVLVTCQGRTVKLREGKIPLANESVKNTLVWLGYIGDDILPSYIEIIVNRSKDPYEPTTYGSGSFKPINILPGLDLWHFLRCGGCGIGSESCSPGLLGSTWVSHPWKTLGGWNRIWMNLECIAVYLYNYIYIIMWSCRYIILYLLL